METNKFSIIHKDIIKKNMMLPEKLSDWQKALPAVNTFLFNFNIQKMNSSGIEQYEWNTFGSFEEK